MDYFRLLFQGAENLTWEEFGQVISDVIGWLVKKKLIPADDDDLAVEVLEDVINIHVATAGVGDVRKNIIWKARTSSNPNLESLKGLREAVYSGVNRRRFMDYRQRIYRQVKERVRLLEHKGVLQSQIWSRRPKKIGLKSWGSLWLDRSPNMGLKAAASSLPSIPCHPVQEHGGKEPKIFDYRKLDLAIPRLCARYGAPLTINEIALVIEQKLSPPLYRYGKEELWPEDSEDFDTRRDSHRSSRDRISCSESSWEEQLLVNDVWVKLRQDLTSDERQILDGLSKGKSKRQIAAQCKCAPGTLESRRQELARKAARHDPCVQARLEYLKRGGTG